MSDSKSSAPAIEHDGTARRPLDAFDAYVEAVRSGELPVGPLIARAVDRHVYDLETAGDRGLVWLPEIADLYLEFFPSVLRHSKGASGGKPFELLGWESFVVGSVFGWYRADGFRRFRFAYVEVPKKNGKSTLCAGIGLAVLKLDGEPGAEIYTSATKRDQARIIHHESTRMVQKSPDLLTGDEPIELYKDSIFVRATDSKYVPLGADSDGADGVNTHAGILDEFHHAKNREILDYLEQGTRARTQPLIVIITTAGYDRKSPCWEQRQRAVRALEGTGSDRVFAFIACPDEDDDPFDPVTWKKANPSFGAILREDDFREDADEAQSSPAFLNSFLRLRLDVWTQQSRRAIPPELWNANAEPPDLDLCRDLPCFVGLDLANTFDTASTVCVFPEPIEVSVSESNDPDGPADAGVEPPRSVEFVYHVVPCIYIPGDDIVKRGKRDDVPYEGWRDRGLIVATPGPTIDYDRIRADIRALPWNVREIPTDPYNSWQIMRQLEKDGFTVAKFRQGFLSMSAPTKELLRALRKGRVRHGGHPVLEWQALNLETDEDGAGNLKPAKDKSGSKIDGIVALIMGIGRAMLQDPTGSVYDRRGIRTL